MNGEKGKKVKLALLGGNVSDSESPAIHTFILSAWWYVCEYECISASPEEVPAAMEKLLQKTDGFNVTIPYKKTVIPYLDALSAEAAAFDSVNTVCGKKGYNTDGEGFLRMLASAGIPVQGKKILVLGAGGSGRSSAAALIKAGAEVRMYQRRRELLEEVCRALGAFPADDPESGGYDILVNCTGVGMHESIGRSPVGIHAFAGCSAAVDLIYSPPESEFLRLAKSAGKKTLNGRTMLFYQAYASDCIYLGRRGSDEEAQALCRAYLGSRADG